MYLMIQVLHRRDIFFICKNTLGASSFSAVTLMSKILTYPLHSTMNFCNGGPNFAIPLLKKRIIKKLFGTIKK